MCQSGFGTCLNTDVKARFIEIVYCQMCDFTVPRFFQGSLQFLLVTFSGNLDSALDSRTSRKWLLQWSHTQPGKKSESLRVFPVCSKLQFSNVIKTATAKGLLNANSKGCYQCVPIRKNIIEISASQKNEHIN